MPNVISATLVKHGKPDPDVFLFAAGWMQASPMRCLVVEDSVLGVTAAIRAGIRPSASPAAHIAIHGTLSASSMPVRKPSLITCAICPRSC